MDIGTAINATILIVAVGGLDITALALWMVRKKQRK